MRALPLMASWPAMTLAYSLHRRLELCRDVLPIGRRQSFEGWLADMLEAVADLAGKLEGMAPILRNSLSLQGLLGLG